MAGTTADVDVRLEKQHWDSNTIGFLGLHLRHARELVRIATGYFSIPGHAQLRPLLGRARTNVLVGFDEAGAGRLRDHLVSEVLFELRQWPGDRYAMVADLVRDLRDSLRIVNARARGGDHAKVFIVDRRAAIVGSANLSRGGLRVNTEALAVQDKPEEVDVWVSWYDAYWHAPDTHDITVELRQALEAWLTLRTPWEVYLKMAGALLPAEEPSAPSATYRIPTEFQMVVVRRTVKQIGDPDRRGAMIVASTGLGKTVMAAHVAHELHNRGVINQVIVFSPVAVKEEWRRRLDSARIMAKVFTVDLLHQVKRQGEARRHMMEALENADERCLIILDESHRLRNRFSNQRDAPGEEIRPAVRRLLDAVEAARCRVLLLTATPMATGVDNVNNQLLLLPHTCAEAPREQMQSQLGLFDSYPWRVERPEDLIKLDVATVLSTPFVARVFGRHDSDADADYIDFPDGTRRYFPSIYLGRVRVPLPLYDELSEVLSSGLLRHRVVSLKMNGEWRRGTDLAEKQVAVDWPSSPAALIGALRSFSGDATKYEFNASTLEREKRLRPLIARLKEMSSAGDEKLLAVRRLVRTALEKDQKVIVFTERHETALYLERELRDLAGDRLVSVVEKRRGRPVLRSSEIDEIMSGFAPSSNRVDGREAAADRYDVLIATDALSEGVNLQDASVLINYDLAWTADTIIQRAGRIMRLTERPRTVEIYGFVPVSEQAQPPLRVVPKVLERVRRLEDRLQAASRLTELPLLPADAAETVARLGRLSSLHLLEIERLPVELAFDSSIGDTSDALHDYFVYQQHRAEASVVPDDVVTAREWENSTSLLVVSLVRYREDDVVIRLNVQTGQVEELHDDVAMAHVRCEQSDPIALVSREAVDRLQARAVRLWRSSRSIADDEAVSHICTMVLVPAGYSGAVDLV